MPKNFRTLLASDAKTLKLQDMTRFTEIYAGSAFSISKNQKLINYWGYGATMTENVFLNLFIMVIYWDWT